MGLTLGDLLGLVLMVVMIFISMATVFRRNGNGSTASAARDMGEAWRMLTQEQRREIEIRDAHIRLLMQQLFQARVEPAPRGQAESIYDTTHDLAKRFSTDELDTLMLSIDIKPDSLRGETVDERARELVLAADRRGRLETLIRAANAARQ